MFPRFESRDRGFKVHRGSIVSSADISLKRGDSECPLWVRSRHVWAIRTMLQVEQSPRDLAMFNLASQGAVSARVRMAPGRRDALHRRGSVRSSPRRLRAR